MLQMTDIRLEETAIKRRVDGTCIDLDVPFSVEEINATSIDAKISYIDLVTEADGVRQFANALTFEGHYCISYLRSAIERLRHACTVLQNGTLALHTLGMAHYEVGIRESESQSKLDFKDARDKLNSYYETKDKRSKFRIHWSNWDGRESITKSTKNYEYPEIYILDEAEAANWWDVQVWSDAHTKGVEAIKVLEAHTGDDNLHFFSCSRDGSVKYWSWNHKEKRAGEAGGCTKIAPPPRIVWDTSEEGRDQEPIWDFDCCRLGEDKILCASGGNNEKLRLNVISG
jgi:hypothetical protein